jgi:hypothetical protein
MNDHHTIKLFLKFGSERNIRSLQEDGTIYMNSIQRFRKIENDELRGDSYEGISWIKNIPGGEFQIEGINHKTKFIHMHLKEGFSEVIGNIYSLYCVSSFGWNNPLNFKINPRIKKFGSHCLLIKDNPRFLSLIEEHLIKINLPFSHGFVEYYDKRKVSRKITVFEKPLEFEYQKEFRFYIIRESTEPLTFNIGSLKEISEMCSTEMIVDEMTLGIPNDFLE